MTSSGALLVGLLLSVAWAEDNALSLLQQRATALSAHEQQDQSVLTDKNTAEGVVRLIDFTKATLVYNNLGGQGPKKLLPNGQPAPEEIRYGNLIQGRPVDLVITTSGKYWAHNASKNGILGGNGQINAKSGTSTILNFTFVNTGTDEPYTLPVFYFTFSDLDERHGGKERESISVSGFDRYYTNDDLQIASDTPAVKYLNQEASATFVSSDYGNYADNNMSPDSPDPTQLSRAVTFKFIQKSSFLATFAITVPNSNRKMKGRKGRNVLFSGISQLVFCQEPSTFLDFKNSTVTQNNLGGKGPSSGPHEIRYSNIGVVDGEAIDLVVTADEDYGYTPWNSSQNGLHGDFGHINLWSGPSVVESEAYLFFTIVRSGTEEQVMLENFGFVVFDFDTGLHERQVEYIELKPNQPGFLGGYGYSSFIVTTSTEIAVTDTADGSKKFSATKHGTEADNPTTAQMLAREVADKSAVFTFRKTARFKATFGITAAGFNTGRNFMFSGQDMYLMCD